MNAKLILAASAAALACSVLIAGSGAAQAPAAAPADKAAFMKERHHHFHEIGAAFKGVLDEFKKPDPSAAELQKYTAALDALAPQVPSWFPVGTGPETGIKTQALATIWQKPDEFKKDAAAFAVAAHNMNTAAQSGNLDAVRASIQPLGLSCKSCHEVFRAKDEH